MYILYVDESGDGGTNPGSSRHLVLGQWKRFTRSLEKYSLREILSRGETHA